jgi:tetratricopeptide (TPR) repeat protein
MRPPYLGLVLLILFLTACNSKPPATEADDFPEFTSEQLEKMMARDPKVQMQLAQGKQQQMSTGDLAEQLEKMIAQDPDNMDNYYHLGKLYHQQYITDSIPSAAQKAIDNYTVVINKEETYENGKGYYNRMLCLLALDANEQALADINKFIVINKGVTPVNYWEMLAEIQFRLGQKVKACQSFGYALEMFEKDSLPIGNQATWEERCH